MTFRVLSDELLSLKFEVWYFYDGSIGEEDIVIQASLENDGIEIPAIGDWEPISVVGHRIGNNGSAKRTLERTDCPNSFLL